MAVLDEIEFTILSTVGASIQSRDAVRPEANAHSTAIGWSHVFFVGGGLKNKTISSFFFYLNNFKCAGDRSPT